MSGWLSSIKTPLKKKEKLADLFENDEKLMQTMGASGAAGVRGPVARPLPPPTPRRRGRRRRVGSRPGESDRRRARARVRALLAGNLQLMREISRSLVDQTNKYKGAVDKLVNGGRVVGMGAGGGMSFSETLSKAAALEGAKRSGSIPALQPSEDHLADVKVRARARRRRNAAVPPSAD